jgi:hypothetical protein
MEKNEATIHQRYSTQKLFSLFEIYWLLLLFWTRGLPVAQALKRGALESAMAIKPTGFLLVIGAQVRAAVWAGIAF